MITFACKKINVLDVIKCSLSLTKSELILFDLFVNDDQAYSTTELSKKLKLDISTIQRGVKKLFEQEIIVRKQINVENGGYYFIYQSKPKAEIRAKITQIVQTWSASVDKTLKAYLG